MLYLHIPYCHHKCTYCGFYSVARQRDLEPYVEALCSELTLRSSNKPLRTIYFGGGTPSLLSINQLWRIINTIHTHYNLSELEEATLEANPEDLTEAYLQGLSEMNFFNRLSIGVQSFNDNELRLLNRVHNGQQAVDAIRLSSQAGFNNVSIDLIMGLPGQALSDWHQNLDHLSSLLPLGAIQHLSCYELTVEPGTMLERQLQSERLSSIDEESLTAQYESLLRWCDAHDFERYEVSNFCRPGFHSRHNSRYWERTPYIGVGAAAHSFDGYRRRWNIADVTQYIASNGTPSYDEETLTCADAFNEMVMTALRTPRGIHKGSVPPNFQEHLKRAIMPFIQAGLILESSTAYQPTNEGIMHADGIAADLFV